MDFGGWSAAVLASKWLLYCTVAAAIGAPASAWLLERTSDAQWQRRTLRHALLACMLGLVATALHFLMLLGDFARTGLSGLVDGAMARMLWDSPIGTALVLRGAGFVAIALASLLAVHGSTGAGPEAIRGQARSGAILLWMAGAVMLAASFALGGHAAEHAGAAPVLLTLHVLVMALWLGALVPLLQACRGLDGPALRETMARFGHLATLPVVLLIVCGALLIVLLLQQPEARLVSAWGITLGAKLLAVGGMLLLAALHRWRLVPKLLVSRDSAVLRRSIVAETTLAALVLAATAALSTAFGPAGM